jgi:putative FmdB family regulatory protein
MPVYDFTCSHCGNKFERSVPVDMRDAPIPCLVCGGTMTRKFGIGGVYIR